MTYRHLGMAIAIIGCVISFGNIEAIQPPPDDGPPPELSVVELEAWSRFMSGCMSLNASTNYCVLQADEAIEYYRLRRPL